MPCQECFMSDFFVSIWYALGDTSKPSNSKMLSIYNIAVSTRKGYDMTWFTRKRATENSAPRTVLCYLGLPLLSLKSING